MNTNIRLEKMAVDTQIGVYAHEKEIKQRLYISMTLVVDFKRAMTSDVLADTVDYAKLSLTIKEVIENTSYELIESVLGEVASIVENQFNIRNYLIEIAKPSALNFVENVSVSIDRL